MTAVVITGARAPSALHLSRIFHEAGWDVILADTLRMALARAGSSYQRYEQLPPPASNLPAFAAALHRLMVDELPALIIPTCEEVFYLARACAALGVASRLFAPPLDVLARAHNKAQFAADAASFGLPVPHTVTLQSADDVARAAPDARDLVFKPAWSRFASHVLIRPDPAALATLPASPATPWVAQAYLPGEELCCYAVARDGRISAFAAYKPLHRAGPGAGIYFAPAGDPDLKQMCERYTSATGWTGQIGFDARRDGTGKLHLIECNPRATSGVHFFGPGSGLVRAITHGEPASPTITSPLMIPDAMWIYGLPQALRSGNLRGWRADYGRARDALAWPSQRMRPFGATLAMLELVRIARANRVALIEAATSGIAWDGAPMDEGALLPQIVRRKLPDGR